MMTTIMKNQKCDTAVILRDESAAVPTLEAHVYLFPRTEYPDAALMEECADLKEHYDNVIIYY